MRERIWKIVKGRAIPMSQTNVLKFVKQIPEELDPGIPDTAEEIKSVEEYYESIRDILPPSFYS